MAAPAKDKCDSCRYYVALGEQHGACHRFPPGAALKRLFVSPVDWCGEYKKPLRKKGKKDGSETYV